MVKPRKVFEFGMHYIFSAVNGTKHTNISILDGMNLHYRDPCLEEFGGCTQSHVRDIRARRIGLQLWKNVDKVCGKIFENGICPFTTYYGKS